MRGFQRRSKQGEWGDCMCVFQCRSVLIVSVFIFVRLQQTKTQQGLCRSVFLGMIFKAQSEILRQIREAASGKGGSEGRESRAAAQHKSKQQMLQQMYQPHRTNTFIYTRERKQINERNSGDARGKRSHTPILLLLAFCSLFLSLVINCRAAGYFFKGPCPMSDAPLPLFSFLLSPNISKTAVSMSVCLSVCLSLSCAPAERGPPSQPRAFLSSYPSPTPKKPKPLHPPQKIKSNKTKTHRHKKTASNKPKVLTRVKALVPLGVVLQQRGRGELRAVLVGQALVERK